MRELVPTRTDEFANGINFVLNVVQVTMGNQGCKLILDGRAKRYFPKQELKSSWETNLQNKDNFWMIYGNKITKVGVSRKTISG